MCLGSVEHTLALDWVLCGALTSGGGALPHASLGDGDLHRAGHGLAVVVGDGEPPSALEVKA